jgi:hypothetical protein
MNPAYSVITHLFIVHFNIISHLRVGLQSCLFLSGFCAKILCKMYRLPCAQLIKHYAMKTYGLVEV